MSEQETIRSRMAECRPGNVKLDEARVRTIKAELGSGADRGELARANNVARGTIDDIATGRNWGWVQPGGAE